MTPTAHALTGALLLILPAASLSGQGLERAGLPTIVEGLTVDAQTGLPFPNVQIRFDTGERVTSDEGGRYAIQGVSPGFHRIAVVTGRCNVTFAELALEPGEIKQVAFSIPSEMVGRVQTAEQMKRASEGSLYTAEDLGEMHVRSLLDAVRRVAPDMVGADGAQPGAGASLIGRTRTAQGVSAPVVVFDGIVAADGVATLRDLKPDDVASLEILRGASRGWQYGTGGQGGVIKVVTRYGDPGHGLAHPDRCEIGDWVGRTP